MAEPLFVKPQLPGSRAGLSENELLDLSSTSNSLFELVRLVICAVSWGSIASGMHRGKNASEVLRKL
jgi:hypothetical protein